MRPIRRIILHCSASDHERHDDIKIIREWHLERGFNDVGYHFFIRKNGQIERGRAINKVGAHCRGHNRDSVGICLHGLAIEKFTQDQFVSAQKLTRLLCTELDIPTSRVSGHNYFNPAKACPVFDVTTKIVSPIMSEVNQAIEKNSEILGKNLQKEMRRRADTIDRFELNS